MVQSLFNFLHTPNWRRQVGWRSAVWRSMARLGLTGLHGLPVSRMWVEVQRRKMPLPHLDPAFVGFRIVQLSDLHYSPMVWARYLRQFVEWVNDMKPNLVVVTGDLITGGYRFSSKVAHILDKLQATHGVVCTLGNHDYSVYGKQRKEEGLRRAAHLERSLERRGLIVLRNEVLKIHRSGAAKPLVIVGLDDEWSNNMDPDKAFDGITDDQPIICLNHNPANADELLSYPWHWMLSGHTHGRQLVNGKVSKRLYGHLHRRYTHGYYAVGGRHLYVNRGLAYGQRIQQWCRPEISVFKLTQEKPAGAGLTGEPAST